MAGLGGGAGAGLVTPGPGLPPTPGQLAQAQPGPARPPGPYKARSSTPTKARHRLSGNTAFDKGKRRGWFVGGVVVLLGSVLLGCGSQPEEPVVAEIEGEVITLAEFRDFDGRIPAGMKEGETPQEKNRQVLETLIDKELLLLEVEDADISQEPRFQKELATYERGRLLDMYFEAQVVGKIVLKPEEVEQHYRDSGRHRALRLGGIMVGSLGQAEDLIAQLEGGGDFSALAREHSVHSSTAERGGDIGTYQTRDQFSDETVEQVLGLEIGQVSKPVEEVFEHGTYYVIYKLLDEIPAPLSASEEIVVNELTQRKRAERVQALSDSLKVAYAPQVRDEAVQLLVERFAEVGEVALRDKEAEQVLCTYGDQSLSLGEFLAKVEALTERALQAADSAQVKQLLHRRILPELFFAAEIEAAGLRQDPRFLAERDPKREELLLETLRWREVDQYVTVSEEEARTFYDENPLKFTSPETAIIVEILVAADTLAQRLAAQLRAGDDPEALADRYTQREGARHHNGKIKLNIYTQSFFPDLYREVQGMEPGQVGGALKVAAGFSVFKLIERQRELSPYNDESKRRARAYVRIDKAKRNYVKFVRNLRHKYSVKILEENLQKI